MKTMISILLLISITCGSLFYLYSENGPVKQWEKEEEIAYQKAMQNKAQQKGQEATKQ